MSGTYFTLNQKYNYLKTQTDNGVIVPVPLPTSSTLADVLLNGNSAGATDIDMNGQNIDQVAIIGGASNLELYTTTNMILTADNGTMTIEAPNNTMTITSLDNMTISTTGVGQNIGISASENLGLYAIADSVAMEAQEFVNIKSFTQDINLTAFNNGTTENGQVYINKSLVNTGDGILNVGKINLSNPLGEIFLVDTPNSVTNTINAEGSLVAFDDGVTSSNTTFGIDGIQHTGDALYLITNGTLGFSSDNMTANNATLALTSTIPSSIANPTLQINNTNATAGTTNGVPSVQYYKSGRNGANNDVICSQSFNANNSSGVKTEFAKIETTIRNVGVGNDDGSISFFATLNGVSTEFQRINGADSDNNFLRPLDMNGNAINTTAGNLSLTSTASAGGGVIVLTSKTQSPTSQYDFSFLNSATNILAHSLSAGWDFFGRVIRTSTGSLSLNASASSGTGTITLTPKVAGNLIFQNLPTSAVGLPTGAVWNNLGVLNIAP